MKNHSKVFRDIAARIYAYAPDEERLLAELAPHRTASDLGEICQILGEIHGREPRFT